MLQRPQPRCLSSACVAYLADHLALLLPRHTPSRPGGLQQSPLYDFDSDTSVDSYAELFNHEVGRILNKHAPLKSGTRRVGRKDCRWLSADACEAKRRCHRHERRYRRTNSSSEKLAFQAARDAARDAITRSRSDAIRQHFDDVAGNSAATWRVVRAVLHRPSTSTVTVSVGRYQAASASTSPTSWNAFTSRSLPACSNSLNLTSAAAGTPARRCLSCHPPLPMRYARCWQRRVSSRHQSMRCRRLCWARPWTSLHQSLRTWQTCYSESAGFQQSSRQLRCCLCWRSPV